MGRHWHIPVVENSHYSVADTYSPVAGFAVAVLAVGQVVRQSGLTMLIVALGVDTAQSCTVSIH